MHQIAQYIEDKGLTQAGFGDLVSTPERKITQGLVWQWINGKTGITPEMAVHIEQVTERAVTRQGMRPDDWERIWPELAEKAAA